MDGPISDDNPIRVVAARTTLLRKRLQRCMLLWSELCRERPQADLSLHSREIAVIVYASESQMATLVNMLREFKDEGLLELNGDRWKPKFDRD